MTSLRLCCLTGILTMQRQDWETGTHSPDMLLQQLFSFLCSWFILCKSLLSSPFPAPASLPCPLSVRCTHFCNLFIFSFSNPLFSRLFYLSLLLSLRKSYQAACQIIRQDICLKTYLQTDIIFSRRHNFNQTWQQNVFRSWQIDTKRRTDIKRESATERGSSRIWCYFITIVWDSIC